MGIKKILLYLGIVVFLSFLLIPFWEMIFTSLQSLRGVFTSPHPLLPEFHFETYTKELWEQVPCLPRYFLNSIIISTAVTIIVVVLAAPAAYSLSRFKFPGRKVLLTFILASNMFAPVIFLIPLFKIMRVLHILNTYWALILPGAALALPFAVWMLTGYFDEIPKDIEEAATVDGASKPKTLTRIVIPLAAPGFITAAIYAFIVSWSQQFVLALALATDKGVMPITRGIYEYFGRNINQWNTIMGSSVIAVIPVLVIFIFLQKYLIKGLTAGAVKG
ncbi:MAG: carbohydrate ABC transporter permease [Candidatus Bathyarchaeota archaeon]